MLLYEVSSEEEGREKPRAPPPLAITLLPTLLVITIRQFLKDTVRPVLSVKRPSSITCITAEVVSKQTKASLPSSYCYLYRTSQSRVCRHCRPCSAVLNCTHFVTKYRLIRWTQHVCGHEMWHCCDAKMSGAATDLQQDVVHIRMSLLNFIQQKYTEGFAPHSLC